ncbi:MAG TPA: hypothetical protein DF614_00740 [Methylococcaceae bacterium]|nr:hypothetical protein [Methylococcaceae bacterium]
MCHVNLFLFLWLTQNGTNSNSFLLLFMNFNVIFWQRERENTSEQALFLSVLSEKNRAMGAL